VQDEASHQAFSEERSINESVSFRQACLNEFRGLDTVLGFNFLGGEPSWLDENVVKLWGGTVA